MPLSHRTQDVATMFKIKFHRIFIKYFAIMKYDFKSFEVIAFFYSEFSLKASKFPEAKILARTAILKKNGPLIFIFN